MQEENEYSLYSGFKEVSSISITILNGTKWVNVLDIEGQTKGLKLSNLIVQINWE